MNCPHCGALTGGNLLFKLMATGVPVDCVVCGEAGCTRCVHFHDEGGYITRSRYGGESMDVVTGEKVEYWRTDEVNWRHDYCCPCGYRRKGALKRSRRAQYGGPPQALEGRNTDIARCCRCGAKVQVRQTTEAIGYNCEQCDYWVREQKHRATNVDALIASVRGETVAQWLIRSAILVPLGSALRLRSVRLCLYCLIPLIFMGVLCQMGRAGEPFTYAVTGMAGAIGGFTGARVLYPYNWYKCWGAVLYSVRGERRPDGLPTANEPEEPSPADTELSLGTGEDARERPADRAQSGPQKQPPSQGERQVLHFKCQKCGQKYQLPGSGAQGKRARCKACGAVFRIAAEEQEAGRR